MRTAELDVGDLVLVDIRGWRFEAEIVGPPADRGFRIEPPRGCGYFHATPRQIVRVIPRQKPIPELAA